MEVTARCFLIIFLFVTSNLAVDVSAAVAIYATQSLETGEQLSNSRGHTLSMQGDCNLVLRDNSDVVWSTGTSGKGNNCYVTMQGDGNLVIYTAVRGVVWASNTARGSDSYELILQEDRNLVIYRGSARSAIWATNTYYKLISAE